MRRGAADRRHHRGHRGIVIARAAGVPVGAVLTHSLLTPAGALALAGGWATATALLSLSLLGAGSRAADLIAVAAVAAIALALITGAGNGRSAPGAARAALLPGRRGDRLPARRDAAAGRRALRAAGPVLVRLAFVGLARAPAAPSLAIAFIAVSIGLGGFALAYRATLAARHRRPGRRPVPLDATVVARGRLHDAARAGCRSRVGSDRLRAARSCPCGAPTPVRERRRDGHGARARRPAPALGLIHGWRASDGSAPIRTPWLGGSRRPGRRARRARRCPPEPPCSPLRVASPGVAVDGDRRPAQPASGAVRRVVLGNAGARPAALRARVPARCAGSSRRSS